MAALTGPFLNQKFDPQSVIPHLDSLAIAPLTKVFANGLAAKNSSGYVVPASADPTLTVLGRTPYSYDNSANASAGPVQNIEVGAFDYNIDTGSGVVTIADIGNAVFAKDDNTVSRHNGGGTYPLAGTLLQVFTPANSSAARAAVLVGFPSVNPTMASTAFKARAVITSIAAYAGTTTGVLTASANAAIGAQDGVTLVAGDVVFLPAVTGGAGGATAAGDEGPYVVTAVGTASAKFVLTRPSWWANGAGIVPGSEIVLSGEGTVWQGSTWRATCGKAQVVGTNAALMYPRVHKGTGAVGTVATALYAMTAAIATAVDATAAAAVKAVLVAGNGTGTLTFTGTGTDVISYTVTNF